MQKEVVIPYKHVTDANNVKEMYGSVILYDTEVQGILLITCPGSSEPLIFLKKNDNGLHQVIWNHKDVNVQNPLKQKYFCTSSPFERSDPETPMWMKQISTSLDASCTYYELATA